MEKLSLSFPSLVFKESNKTIQLRTSAVKPKMRLFRPLAIELNSLLNVYSNVTGITVHCSLFLDVIVSFSPVSSTSIDFWSIEAGMVSSRDHWLIDFIFDPFWFDSFSLRPLSDIMPFFIITFKFSGRVSGTLKTMVSDQLKSSLLLAGILSNGLDWNQLSERVNVGWLKKSRSISFWRSVKSLFWFSIFKDSNIFLFLLDLFS